MNAGHFVSQFCNLLTQMPTKTNIDIISRRLQVLVLNAVSAMIISNRHLGFWKITLEILLHRQYSSCLGHRHKYNTDMQSAKHNSILSTA
jgi:hypothetical protein